MNNLMNEVQQGINELIVITPIMKDLHNNVDNQILFLKNIILIDKDKYSNGYQVILDSLEKKGFTILIN